MAYIQNIEVDWSSLKALKAGSLSTSTLFYLQNDLQYVPFLCAVNTNTESDVEALYFTGVNRDPSARNPNTAALAAGAKASEHIQNIVYTSTLFGTIGNSTTIQYVNDAVAVGQEYVTVSGSAIVVHIVSGSSTAQQVVSAVVGWSAYNGLAKNNAAASAYLVTAVADAGSEGVPQTTQGPTSLAGGVDPVTVLSDWETNFLSTATKVSSFGDGIAAQIA